MVTSTNAAPAPEASERLPPRALRLWRLTTLLVGAPIAAGACVVALLVDGLPGWARLAIAAVAILGVAGELAVQGVRYRLWSYRIDDEELTLRHGWPLTSETVVPMVRVQHVAVSHGPLSRALRLASLHISTAAGTLNIPALDRQDAELIRGRIAELARIVDDL